MYAKRSLAKTADAERPTGNESLPVYAKRSLAKTADTERPTGNESLPVYAKRSLATMVRILLKEL